MKRQQIFCLFFIFFFVQIFAQNDEKIDQVTITTKTKKYKSKKENPAFAIMQEVWKRKKSNGLSKFNSYQYDEYEKIEIDLDNLDSAFTKKKIFKDLDFIFKYGDSTAKGKLTLPIFLNESFYTHFGENNPQKREKKKLIGNKTAGFQNNEIMSTTAKNLFREINIYDATINYFDIGFPGPLSEDGFGTYNYNLEDTLKIKGEDCYLIKYEPRNEDILALRGNLYISTKNYAVVKATLRSTKKLNVNFVNSIFTELEFDNPDESTFLPTRNYTELEISMFSKSKDAKSLTSKKTVDYSNYIFNQPIDSQIFNEVESNETVAQSDDFWNKVRKDSLSKSEQNIYTMLDEMKEVPRFKHLVKLYETLDSGYYNVGHAIDIGDLYSTVGFNDVEGTRVRIGARTYFSPNDMWRVAGYLAYGFKDDQVKYGAEFRYMFNKKNRFTLGAGTRRDVMQLGVQLTNDDGIMTRSFASSSIFSSGNNFSLSSVNKTSIFASIEPIKDYQIRVDGTMQSIISANPEKFNLMFYLNGLRKTTLDSHVTLSLMARPGAKYTQSGVDRYQFTSIVPTFVLKYTRGIEGLFNADFNYNKLQFLYNQPIITGSWGRSIINFEAGKNFDPVPLSLQNVIPGNQSYAITPNTFALLNYYEFVADQYATLHYEHHFNGKILGYIPLIKKLKLRELAFFRTAVGTLSDASKNINVDGAKYSAPTKPYYEYGFGIENIGFGNLRIFRIDFNWRGNYLENMDARKFGIKTGFQFNF